MNVYVETNFVLELVFQQEQTETCESILSFCDSGNAQLILPAYCLAEPNEKLIRQSGRRKELQKVLDAELRQLKRTSAYTDRITNIPDVTSLLVQSNEEERQRFNYYRARLLTIAEIVPLTSEILNEAASYESNYALTAQDAIVYTSVIYHLRRQTSFISCFMNKNSKDFGNPDIIDELSRNNCRMIPKFDQGYEFIQAKY
ncbi:MAG: PIN domain-containing protein [Chloroflexi bacterium]|nr:PIN domain-containing protein [Chloroflexota bacterium]